MKKLFTLAIAAFSIFTVTAQSERMVLIEEGTNASCGPCAAQNPGFHTLLNANTDNVISIKYQTWWPGYDPMYLHNTADVQNRIEYYGINGVPTATLDGAIITGSYPGFNGQYYAGAPGGFSQTTLTHAAGIDAAFDIDINYTITPETISVTCVATCTQATTGNLRFRIAVIEKEISFDSAPGTNGETEFYNVMKKMLPTANGSTMPQTFEVGETYTITESWNLSNIYDINEVAVVAFIQNNSNKTVLQAAYDDSAVLEASGSLNAAALSLEGVSNSFCTPNVTPTVVIRNHGSETLTSLTVNYTLNGTSGSIDWSGNLPFFETTEISLGDISFSPSSQNTLNVTLENPNSGIDENIGNNTAQADIAVAESVGNEVIVTVNTDQFGGETYWRIINESSELVAQGGNQAVGTNSGTGNPTSPPSPTAYTNSSTHVQNVTLGNSECVTFEIYDFYGDGICCAYGQGSYSVKDAATNEILFSGGQFTDEERGKMVSGVLGIKEATSLSSFNIYPNPTRNDLNIQFDLAEAQHVSVDVHDILGKLIKSFDYGMLSGTNLRMINMDSENEGMYMLVMNIGEQRSVKKFTLAK